MIENIKIESIQEKDFEVLVALFQEFADFQQQSDKMKNNVKEMIENKDLIHGYTLKTNDGATIGYVTYFFAYYTWSGKSIYMEDLYVKDEYRGQGLGTQLIEKVISLAKSQNCKKMRWQVSDWNSSATKFYESLGANVDSSERNCDIML